MTSILGLWSRSSNVVSVVDLAEIGAGSSAFAKVAIIHLLLGESLTAVI